MAFEPGHRSNKRSILPCPLHGSNYQGSRPPYSAEVRHVLDMTSNKYWHLSKNAAKSEEVRPSAYVQPRILVSPVTPKP